MKGSVQKFFLIIHFVGIFSFCFGKPDAGFSLPDSAKEITIKYESIDNLIILPIIINDAVKVNLALDTGCSNMILFGKRFEGLFYTQPSRNIFFTGMGSGSRVIGNLSLENKVEIASIKGYRMPIVIVPKRKLFGPYPQIDGVIGYDVFSRFQIEIRPDVHQVIFRINAEMLPAGFEKQPIRIDDSKPVLLSEIFIEKDQSTRLLKMVIDTGSVLGLLLKLHSKAYPEEEKITIGIGIGGVMKGFSLQSFVKQPAVFTERTNASVITSSEIEEGSIGMGLLKHYHLIINYARGYVGFKKIT